MIKQVQFACPECASINSIHEGETLRICMDCGQDWYTDLDYSRTAAQRRQEATRNISGIMGAERVEGRRAGRTGGASDLPWRFICGFVFLALFAYALPDLRAWCNGEPPVMIGDRP